MKNPPFPTSRELAALFPMKRKEEKDRVKRQRAKKKRIKKIVGKVQGERRSKGERERYQMQGW